MCKISVIIPVYNTEKYLDKCLSSVVNQTFKDIEIIIVDDGSTDNSYRICQKYANQDKRIVLLQQSNQGQGFARNKALLKANGEYIFFLDSDDYLELDAFELLYNEAINKNSDLVMLGWEKIDEQTNTTLFSSKNIDTSTINNKNEKIPYIFSEIGFAPWTALIKRDLIIDNYLFFPNVFHEDMYIMPKIYYYAKNISYINKKLYFWLERKGSTTTIFSMKHAIGIGGLLIDWTNFLIKEKIYEQFYMDIVKKFILCLNYIKIQTNMFSEKNEKIKILKYFTYIENNIDTNSIESISLNPNFIFSKNINSLYRHIQYLKKYKYKIAIYGNGLIGNLIAKELKDQIVVIVDKAKDSFSKYAKVCIPEELNNYKFDILVICVLGREEEIINSLDIEKDKIFEFNFLNTSLLEIENSNKPISIEDKKSYNVVFIPHKDYHFKTMALISKKLEKQNISSCILDITDYYRDERVRKEALNFPNIELLDLSIFLREGINYKLLVSMNDWDGMVVKPLIINAKKSNRKTLGIVEGINDFLDVDTNMRRTPYQITEYLFLTGEHDKQFFKEKEKKCFTVGIPRLHNFLKEKPKFPKKPLVVINVNFSYGVLEDKREYWLNSVLEACRILNFEYIITQHPEDSANLSKYNISKLDMYETIRQGSIVISRFGSIILEALAMGKPVVYHNPHNEKVLKFQEPMNAYSCSSDVKSLVEAIKYELSLDVDYRQRANDFLNHHCHINECKDSAGLCAKYIKEILDYE
ncbi:glycosyltransferase family 2 protein [Aliarcobacter butzleri]